MNDGKIRRSPFTLSIPLLLLVLGFAFVQMGWFYEVEVQEKDFPESLLIGENYHGKSTDKQLNKLVNKMFDLMEARQQEGAEALALIYYGDPDNTKDSLRVFVGVVVSDTTLGWQQGMNKYVMPAYPTLSADIDPTELFSPNPGFVKKTIQSEIEKRGLEARNRLIEVYVGRKKITTYIPVQPKATAPPSKKWFDIF